MNIMEKMELGVGEEDESKRRQSHPKQSGRRAKGAEEMIIR